MQEIPFFGNDDPFSHQKVPCRRVDPAENLPLLGVELKGVGHMVDPPVEHCLALRRITVGPAASSTSGIPVPFLVGPPLVQT